MKTTKLTRTSGVKGNRLLVTPAIKPARRLQAVAVPKPNLKVKNIVVPIDFSAESQKALQYASKLASQFGAVLKLIHVVEPGPLINDLPDFTRSDQEIAKESRIRLQALAKDEIDERIPVQTGVRIGKPYHEIVSFAKVVDADLVVVSTHGYTGLKHTLLGSTAERVVRYATCPVLVVREARKERL
jgi:universal stress protein A